MKISIISVVVPLLAQLVAAVPTPTYAEAEVVERAQIAKRATITDIATTGYATQNGG
jgi:pectate lyase